MSLRYIMIAEPVLSTSLDHRFVTSSNVVVGERSDDNLRTLGVRLAERAPGDPDEFDVRRY